MKKAIFFTLFGVFFLSGIAQNTNDVYQYNISEINGTARYVGTAGSIMAVGADLSAVSDNPAGATGFVSNRLSWSLGGFSKQNSGIYNNEATYTSELSILSRPFYTNSWGAVFPFVSTTEKWNKFVFGITGKNDFHHLNNIEVQGQSAGMQTAADYFVLQAEGIPTGDLTVYSGESLSGVYQWLGASYGSYAQQAFLAYQGYVIDPVVPDSLNTAYVSNASYSSPLFHKLNTTMRGKKFSTDFFVSGQYEKKLSLGFALSLRTLNYTQTRKFGESGYNTHSILQFMEYETVLESEAEGVQIKLGAMYQVTPQLKFSVAYHSPTWWEMQETTQERLYTEALDVDDLDGDGDFSEINTFDLNPNTKNVFDSYRYVSPGQWFAGISYTMGKYAFISLVYGYRDWRMTRFYDLSEEQFSKEYYDYLNGLIQDKFTATHQIRLGGELRLDQWTLRGGLARISSPFVDHPKMYQDYSSLGIGYDFGNFELDLGFIQTGEKYAEQFFPVGLTEKYETYTFKTRYNLTLRYNF